MPSRQFYIQQSCLNAARDALLLTQAIPASAYFDYMTNGGHELPETLKNNILSWYRDRVREYGEPE